MGEIAPPMIAGQRQNEVEFLALMGAIRPSSLQHVGDRIPVMPAILKKKSHR